MTEVIPGIHWIKSPIRTEGIAPSHVNIYLVRGNSGYLLVDTGWNTDETFVVLQKGLAEAGADIKDISRILVTHIHPDHYGLAGRVKKLSGAEMLFHEIEKGFIEPRYIHMDTLLEQTARWLAINGVPHDETVDIRNATVGLEKYVIPTFPDATLQGGETITTGIFTFQVLWTPGHAAGHICLYEPDKKVLLSGDHILPTITPNIGLHPQSLENPLGRYLKSLHEIKHLDIEHVLPGHDRPFTQLNKRIDEILRHHEERSREILALTKGEAKTAYRIARDVTWGITGRWQDLPPFHKRIAIFETLSHLEMMAADGRIEKQSRDGMIYYRQT